MLYGLDTMALTGGRAGGSRAEDVEVHFGSMKVG